MTFLLARTPAACTAEAMTPTIGAKYPCRETHRGGLCLRDIDRPTSTFGTYLRADARQLVGTAFDTGGLV